MVDILVLPIKPSVTPASDFYFEIQEAVGGAGSSKRLHINLLTSAILAALPVMEHSSLTDLGADDHPQYLNNSRGDLRYAPIGHLTDPDPHPQYEQAGEAQAKVDAAMATHLAAANPHPQYQTNAEVETQIDTRLVPYDTSAVVDTKVAAAMTAHLSAPNPHPQYVTDAELDAAIAAQVTPVAQELVADLIANDAEALINAAVGPAVEAALDTQNSVNTIAIVAGVAEADYTLGNYFTLTLTQDTTLDIPTVPVGQGRTISILITQDVTGNWDLLFPANFKPTFGSLTTPDQTAGAISILALTTFGGGRWEYTMQKCSA